MSAHQGIMAEDVQGLGSSWLSLGIMIISVKVEDVGFRVWFQA